MAEHYSEGSITESQKGKQGIFEDTVLALFRIDLAGQEQAVLTIRSYRPQSASEYA